MFSSNMYNPEDSDAEERRERNSVICMSLGTPAPTPKEYITPVYTRNAIDKYYNKNKDDINKQKRERYNALKNDEDYKKKRKEYAERYRLKKRAEKLNKIEKVLGEIREQGNEELYYDCLEIII